MFHIRHALFCRESEGSFRYGNWRKEAQDLHAVIQHFHGIGCAIGHSKGIDLYVDCQLHWKSNDAKLNRNERTIACSWWECSRSLFQILMRVGAAGMVVEGMEGSGCWSFNFITVAEECRRKCGTGVCFNIPRCLIKSLIFLAALIRQSPPTWCE